jgi:hypothetical protein
MTGVSTISGQTRGPGPAEKAVAAVLRRLPVLPGRESKVDSWAQRIAFVGSLASITELPRARRTGTKAALAEIDKLARAALRLRNEALSMHRDALAALERRNSRHPLRLASDMAALVNVCNAAAGDLKAAPPHPAPAQPTKPSARAVTHQAAAAYEALTSKAATITVTFDGKATGPWLAMLTGVFAALGIEASPEAQARSMEKSPRKIRR